MELRVKRKEKKKNNTTLGAVGERVVRGGVSIFAVFSGWRWISMEDRRKEERRRENERRWGEKRRETKTGREEGKRRRRGRKGVGVGILRSRHSAASERVRREPEVYFREPHRFRKLYSLYEPERLTANPSLVWLASFNACTNWDLCGDLSSSSAFSGTILVVSCIRMYTLPSSPFESPWTNTAFTPSKNFVRERICKTQN